MEDRKDYRSPIVLEMSGIFRNYRFILLSSTELRIRTIQWLYDYIELNRGASVPMI